MKTKCNAYREAVPQGGRLTPPVPRAPGFPWTLAYPHHWLASVVSHSTVAVLAAVLVALIRPTPPAPAPSPSPRVPSSSPSELAVDLRGGSPSTDGADVQRLAPHTRLDIVARHDGRRGEGARLLVQALPLSGTAASGGPGVFVTLDPRRMVWREHSFHYRGQVDETLPLAPGLWRLTFMISDRRECDQSLLYACAKADAWVRVTQA